MKKCDCYCEEHEIVGWFGPDDKITKLRSRCNGTRERDECSCGGDRTKCDFYPEVRKKGRKKKEPKFGEWISVEDGLPEKNQDVLCCTSDKYDQPFIGYRDKYSGHWCKGRWAYTWGKITHWMPLPEPHKGE